jgi:hypothetical protein
MMHNHIYLVTRAMQAIECTSAVAFAGQSLASVEMSAFTIAVHVVPYHRRRTNLATS